MKNSLQIISVIMMIISFGLFFYFIFNFLPTLFLNWITTNCIQEFMNSIENYLSNLFLSVFKGVYWIVGIYVFFHLIFTSPMFVVIGLLFIIACQGR